MTVKEEIQQIADQLERAGLALDAKAVVTAAQDAAKFPALHKSFDWDNEKAGNKWRLQQAHQLIIRCRISIKEGSELGLNVVRPVRMFQHLREDSGYRSTEAVISDADMYRKFIDQLDQDFVRMKSRISDIEGLRPVDVQEIRPSVNALEKWIADRQEKGAEQAVG